MKKETKVIDINELKFDENNFNKHNEQGMELLEKSLRENGFGRSILLDKDNNIVGGNGVTEQAKKLGTTKVRVIETDGTEIIAVKRTDLMLDSERGKKMALADNSVAHINLQWNKEELQKAQDKWELVPEEWGVITETSINVDDFFDGLEHESTDNGFKITLQCESHLQDVKHEIEEAVKSVTAKYNGIKVTS